MKIIHLFKPRKRGIRLFFLRETFSLFERKSYKKRQKNLGSFIALCGLAPRAMRLLNSQAVQNKPPRGQRVLTRLGTKRRVVAPTKPSSRRLVGHVLNSFYHSVVPLPQEGGYHESMQICFSMRLHAALVLHKKSVYHFNAPWFRVNFVRYEQNFNSGRRMMFCFSLELTKR